MCEVITVDKVINKLNLVDKELWQLSKYKDIYTLKTINGSIATVSLDMLYGYALAFVQSQFI